jgi:hypothetical protein
MNKVILSLSTAGALLCGAALNAAVYTDVHDEATFLADIGQDRVLLNISGNPRSSYTNTFDITDDGYVPGSGLSSAVATFWVRDQTRNEGADEMASVELDGNWFANSASNLPFSNISFGGSLALNLLMALEANGTLTYTITAVTGNFYFKRAELTAVPDGGTTIALFGLGLLGLAAAKRKARSA